MEGELKIGMRTHFAAQIRRLSQGRRKLGVGSGWVATPEILAETDLFFGTQLNEFGILKTLHDILINNG